MNKVELSSKSFRNFIFFNLKILFFLLELLVYKKGIFLPSLEILSSVNNLYIFSFFLPGLNFTIGISCVECMILNNISNGNTIL